MKLNNQSIKFSLSGDKSIAIRALILCAHFKGNHKIYNFPKNCLLYTSPSPRDKRQSRMPSSA